MNGINESERVPIAVRYLLPTIVFAIAAAAANVAAASPTTADFRACDVRAAAIQQGCLDQQRGHDDNKCWLRARDAKRACYEMVREAASMPSPEQRQRVEEALRQHRAAGERKTPLR